MKKTNLLTGLIVSAGFLISASANGSVFAVGLGGGPAGDRSVLIPSFAAATDEFDVGGTPATWARGPALSSPRLSTGPASGAVSPFNDTTQYASVDTNPTPGTGQLAWPGDPNSYIGLYWGSIDTYNHIMIADADSDHLIDLAHFGIPMPANGDHGRGQWTDVNR